MERKPLDKTVLSIHPEKAPPDNNPPPPHDNSSPTTCLPDKTPTDKYPRPQRNFSDKKTPVKTLSTNYPIKTTQQKILNTPSLSDTP